MDGHFPRVMTSINMGRNSIHIPKEDAKVRKSKDWTP